MSKKMILAIMMMAVVCLVRASHPVYSFDIDVQLPSRRERMLILTTASGTSSYSLGIKPTNSTRIFMDLDARLVSREFPITGKVLKAEIEEAPALTAKYFQKTDDCGTDAVQDCFTFHDKNNGNEPMTYLYTIRAFNVSVSRNMLTMEGDHNQSYHLRHGGFSNIEFLGVSLDGELNVVDFEMPFRATRAFFNSVPEDEKVTLEIDSCVSSEPRKCLINNPRYLISVKLNVMNLHIRTAVLLLTVGRTVRNYTVTLGGAFADRIHLTSYKSTDNRLEVSEIPVSAVVTKAVVLAVPLLDDINFVAQDECGPSSTLNCYLITFENGKYYMTMHASGIVFAYKTMIWTGGRTLNFDLSHGGVTTKKVIGVSPDGYIDIYKLETSHNFTKVWIVKSNPHHEIVLEIDDCPTTTLTKCLQHNPPYSCLPSEGSETILETA